MRKTEVSIMLPAAIVCLILNLSSCISSKNLTYFNNLPDSVRIKLNTIPPPQELIQVNDVLDIAIGGENEKTVDYINSYFTGGKSINVIVDVDGNIELPKIGKLHVLGLTKEIAKDTITNAYKEYLLDPIVQVKFGNFRFTVLGEVKSPGVYDVNTEKVSILEALGRAGDLTEFAKRNDIKIIRDINGNREIISLNVSDKDILYSPDYYINRYDIIYVGANDIKATTGNIQRVIPYIGLLTSVLAVYIALRR